MGRAPAVKIRNKISRTSVAPGRVSGGGISPGREVGEKLSLLNQGYKLDYSASVEDRIIAARSGGQEVGGGPGRRSYMPREGPKVESASHAVELYSESKLDKVEMPLIAFTLGLVKDPDSISANDALESIRQAAQGDVSSDVEELVKLNKGMEAKGARKKTKRESEKKTFASPEEQLAYQKRQHRGIKRTVKNQDKDEVRIKLRKKSQYSNEAYTGNGGEQPGTHTEGDSELETQDRPTRYKERKRKVLVKRDVQPKTDTEDNSGPDVEDPRNEGLKFAIADISAELSKLSVDELQDIGDQLSNLTENNRTISVKGAIVVDEYNHNSLPSDELLENLRSSYN